MFTTIFCTYASMIVASVVLLFIADPFDRDIRIVSALTLLMSAVPFLGSAYIVALAGWGI